MLKTVNVCQIHLGSNPSCLITNVILSKWVLLSEPQFPNLEHWAKSSTFLPWLRTLSEKLYIKDLLMPDFWYVIDFFRISQQSQTLDSGFYSQPNAFSLLWQLHCQWFSCTCQSPSCKQCPMSLGCGNWAFGLEQPEECEGCLGLRLGQGLSWGWGAVWPERSNWRRHVRGKWGVEF